MGSSIFVGGNDLASASAGPVADFVRQHSGHTVISKVLIANNGIAAVKEIRSIRKWAYETFGTERAVEFVVMATPEDLKVNADYIRMADQYVEVPGGSNNNNYANVELIVDIAERQGVHAVWAGWGHASENPRLPESLAASKQKIVFIGPPGSAMRSLGDKISSTIVAQSASVPTMPWSGSGITDTVLTEGFVTVPQDAYDKACVTTVEQGLESAEKIGFPIMIKASEGGGGKGIRMVHEAEKFTIAFNAVLGEVPGSPVFIMKLAGSARHLEVQLLADQYGNAISLFGRDCSVQRRHQKIIEEAPVTIAKAERFEEMEKAAVRLAKLVGYVSAGTVEYLYSHTDDSFFFLELNPRLQVEHPTTEMVSGVNLPAAQLQIAMGIPMHRIRDIRTLYGVEPHGTSNIDFDFAEPDSIKSQRKPKPSGHVVAVRITAENPDEGFKPSSGALQELNFRSNTNVWGYFSVGTAGGLHEFADSQFGHIFAYGSNRSESRKNMVVALKEISIRGDFRTTVEYLIKLLETQAFEDNTITTAWLDTLISNKLTAERPEFSLAVICGAVTKAQIALKTLLDEYKSVLVKGQVPSKDTLKTVFEVEFIYEGVKYNFTAARSSSTMWTIYINGGYTHVGVRGLADGGLLVLLDGRSHSVYWREEVGAVRLMVDSKTCLIEKENDPTQLRSPSPGKLVRYLVEAGESIKAGQPYAEIEVMKMYMPLVATEDGTPLFVKQPGVSLSAGDILGILTLDDPNRVRHAKPFEGLMPVTGSPSIIGTKSHQQLASLKNTLCDILDGFDNVHVMQKTIDQLTKVLADPELPYLETLAIMASLAGRIPSRLEDTIRLTVDTAHTKGQNFPAVKVKKQLDAFIAENLRAQDRQPMRTALAALYEVVDRFRSGLKLHEWSVLADLLQRYYDVEELFVRREEDVILSLREQHKDDLDKVVSLVLSHSKVSGKNRLVMSLLEVIKIGGDSFAMPDNPLNKILQQLADSEAKSVNKVALKAREVLIHCQQPSYEERAIQMEQILKNAVTTSFYGESGTSRRLPSAEVLKELTDSRYTVYDVLPEFFEHSDTWVALAALEVYIVRAYRAYTILHVDHEEGETGGDGRPHVVTWRFKMGQSPDPVSTPRFSETPNSPMLSTSPLLGNIHSALYLSKSQMEPIRFGAMTSFPNLYSLQKNMPSVIALFPAFSAQDFASRHGSDMEAPHVLNIALRIFDKDDDRIDDEWREKLLEVTRDNSKILNEHGIRRLTYVLCRKDAYPWYFTMRDVHGTWSEQESIRNIEPALAYQLELKRMSHFRITPVFTTNRQIHMFYAVGRGNPSDMRFFVRALVRPGRVHGAMRTRDYLISESDRLVTEILNNLEIVGPNYRNCDGNHLSINFIYNLAVTFEDVQEALAGFIERHGKRLWRLRVTGAEIRIVLEDAEGNILPIRAVIENVSGFVVKYEAYSEVTTDRGHAILKSIGPQGSLHLQPVDTPFSPKEHLQPKRYKAHLSGTTYVYDFPDLFRQALRTVWKESIASGNKMSGPSDPLSAKELVLDEHNKLQSVTRPFGSNTCGMVAWIFVMLTPEYPKGRKVVVVANDITHQIGSFGPAEDDFFYKVTVLARELGLPRIYLSANSGARIGLADELMSLFQCAWKDVNNPTKGFDYLYLTPETYSQIKDVEKVGKFELVDENGEARHRITDIIGLQDGLGVECLRGSGLIAGETSRAYDDIFTITLVTCRSVGIGAYLVRLGQRAVQVEGQPIILTGAPALNKVLGREVYTSNLQLGGTQIMHKNGVTHLVANSDLEGAQQIVQWLSYVPESKGKPLPLSPIDSDSWDRKIEFIPPKGPYDPRWFLEGKSDPINQTFQTGFFDKGSFQETLSGWAQTVVTGRARLGGIPMGCIAVETRTMERVVPADPANAQSFEQKIMEAGQVWYPNSAHKTAQAIMDFNREGLPLIIFANWRGFSGGQQDMLDAVLKEGSKIVDGLSSYKQPVFVYIVPNGELRGGAWVVLDPTINITQMEMYADPDSRAGVLEPEGIVEIKYRRDKILSTMSRLDTQYAQLKSASLASTSSVDEKSSASASAASREADLLPTYQQVAIHYSDLHDRVGRMEAKGCAIPCKWEDSRKHFFWRLKRRLAEEDVYRQLTTASPEVSRRCHIETLKAHLEEAKIDRKSDTAVLNYLEGEGLEDLKKLTAIARQKHLTSELSKYAQTDQNGTIEAIVQVVKGLSAEQREIYQSMMDEKR